MLAPRLVQPGDALVQPFGLGNQLAGFRFEHSKLAVVRAAVGRQRAVQPHLVFAQLAREQRALVQQPCEQMHHPGGGLEPLGRQREAHKGILADHRLARARGKHRTHFIRQNQRFGVERLDDRARKIGGASHAWARDYAPPRRPATRVWLLSK